MKGATDTIEDFLRLGRPPRVIAHRGFSGVAPENTLAAFERAIDAGADMFEFDITLTRDGRAVCIHDETLDRTTDGAGPVLEKSLAEIQALDAGGWFSEAFWGERIPTLEAALDLARGRILANIEIKPEALDSTAGGGIVARTIAAVREREMTGRVIVSSFDPVALVRMRDDAPEIATASLFNRSLHQGMAPADVTAQVGSRAFNINDRYLTAEQVAQCHRAGRAIGAYTINAPGRLRELVALGVDAVFTDRPDVMLEVLGRG